MSKPTKFLRPALADLGGPQPQPLTLAYRNGPALPVEGREVSWTGDEGRYWMRRLAEGSVLEGRPDARTRPPKAAKDPKE